jgi:hypothetical protein
MKDLMDFKRPMKRERLKSKYGFHTNNPILTSQYHLGPTGSGDLQHINIKTTNAYNSNISLINVYNPPRSNLTIDKLIQYIPAIS